jgi:aromatic-L-amino-acid decarboxylase
MPALARTRRVAHVGRARSFLVFSSRSSRRGRPRLNMRDEDGARNTGWPRIAVPSHTTVALAAVPKYLVTREQDEVVNYLDYGVQLGRRFRALELWMIIRGFGTDGLADRLREHCALAQQFAGWVTPSDDWELMAPVPFSLVCFRYAPRGMSDLERDKRNEAIMHAVNAGGDVFLSHTKPHGRFTLRLATGNRRTEERHVALAWQRLRVAAERVT